MGNNDNKWGFVATWLLMIGLSAQQTYTIIFMVCSVFLFTVIYFACSYNGRRALNSAVVKAERASNSRRANRFYKKCALKEQEIKRNIVIYRGMK